MKKGDKVKCVDNLGNGYLTTGKVYDVIAGEGDFSIKFPREIHDGITFDIINDNGKSSFCLCDDCSHAVWEVVND